jgi:hypothetical protein
VATGEIEPNRQLMEVRMWQSVLQGVAYGLTDDLWIGLWNSNPATTPAGEVAAAEYARQQVSFATVGSDPVTSFTNTSSHTWTATSGSWGAINYYVFLTAETFGSVVFVWIAGGSDTVTTGESIKIEPGDLNVSLRGTDYPVPLQ